MVEQDSTPNNMGLKNRSKRKRKPSTKARVAQQGLPEDVAEFTSPIPSLTLEDAKEQTAPKMDKNFEAVFSRLVGAGSVRPAEKGSNQV